MKINTNKVKKIIIEVFKYLAISCFLSVIIFIAYELSGMDPFQLGPYTKKHSEVNSESFERYYDQNYDKYEFHISADNSKANEIWIFEKTNDSFFSFFNLLGTKYKRSPAFHSCSSDKPAKIHVELYQSGKGITEADTVLIYYSTNNNSIANCKYTIKNQEGEEKETKLRINPYQKTFLLLIPCDKKLTEEKYEVTSVSFFDIDGNLVFKDTDI